MELSPTSLESRLLSWCLLCRLNKKCLK